MLEEPKVPWTTKLFHRLAFATLGLAFALLVWIFYVSFFPFKVAEIKSPVTIDGGVVQQGSVVFYEMEYCKYIEAPATIRVQLENHVSYPLLPIETNAATGCRTQHFGPIIIPSEVPAGEYRINFDYEYSLFRTRKIHLYFSSEKFQIVDKPTVE